MIRYNHQVIWWTTSWYFIVGVTMVYISATNSCLMNKLFTNDTMGKQNKILNKIAYVFAASYLMRCIGLIVVIY